jgi:hypothetical protein
MNANLKLFKEQVISRENNMPITSNFKIGEKVIVALPIEVWTGESEDIIINIDEIVTITNIFKSGNIQIDRVNPKYGCFLPAYFKKVE